MLGFGHKMAHAREEPVTGQNWAWGTKRDNFHVCSWTDQLDWPAGRVNWTDQLEGSAGWTSWTDQLDRPAGQTSWTNKLDGPAGWTSWTDSWMDQLDGPAGWISWMDQFSSFEASASSLIQRLTFQFVHCHSFRVRRRPCFLSHILYPSSHLPEYHVPYPISIIPYSLGAIWQVEKNFKVNY